MTAFEPGTIFTPGTFPTHTYVSRSEADEELLQRALSSGGSLVSIVGPSKTGKTVLVNKVVDEELLISLSGSLIDSADAMWASAAEMAGTPHLSTSETIELFADEKRVLLIDDFHYVGRDSQRRIAQQLKDAVAKGVLAVVVSVPHRADDAIRGNPDLRGRVRKIDLDYWDPAELARIAEAGFPLLNVRLPDNDVRRISDESVRSPQLMQALCLEICALFHIEKPDDSLREIDLDHQAVADVATATVALTDCKTPFEILSEGPRERGRPRTKYTLHNGQEGDVYTVILRALANDPPRLDFSPAELRHRVASIVKGDPPTGGSLRQASFQMDKIIGDRTPGDRVFAWDAERQYIDIPDPHFLFYLRWGVPK